MKTAGEKVIDDVRVSAEERIDRALSVWVDDVMVWVVVIVWVSSDWSDWEADSRIVSALVGVVVVRVSCCWIDEEADSTIVSALVVWVESVEVLVEVAAGRIDADADSRIVSAFVVRVE